VPGPVHGMIEKLGLARSQMYLKPNGELHIKTPLGADIAIRTPHGTHLKEIIKEACRYSAIQHLCDRIAEDSSEVGRQDMVGISPYVDTSATMALSRAKLKKEAEIGGEEEATDLRDNQACPEGQTPMICKAFGIGARRIRKLHTIISGSIRPPHRLIHTGMVETDICDHSECRGARCDTKHIFWDCHKWNKVRSPFKYAVDKKIETLGKHRKMLATEILQNNCFRNCGICPGNAKALQSTYDLKDDDTCNQAPSHSEIYDGHDNANCVEADGYWWYKVYTDGSNQNGTSRELARAGWGVYFAKDSRHNIASKLHGPVQTSYRAELRALLHVVATTSDKVLVMIDCKSVVNTFLHYRLHGRPRCGKLQEEDLWNRIFDTLDNREELVRVQWMPSHLDDPKNILKRTQALASGLVSEEDIEGNVQADKLADQGVKQHVCNKHHATAARDRLELTIVVQKMMLTIWEAYLEGNTIAQEVNEYDEKEVEAAMRQIQLNELEEYDDDDPFGNIDADGNDANPHDDDDSLGKNSAEVLNDFQEPTSDQQPTHLNAATSDSQVAYPKVKDVVDCINAGPIICNRASVSDSVGLTAEPVANEGDRDNLTLQQRYPKYGWNSEYMHRDYQLQVTLPDGEDPTLFGSSSIASATPPISNALSQDKDGWKWL